MTDSPWIRAFTPADPERSLVVCLPHAGGSASFYRPLGLLLSGTAEVWAIQYPGRQERFRERQCATMAELADVVADVLDGYAPGRRLVLFGHSMGALLGFEVVRRLEARGRRPHHLVVSGRAAPSHPLPVLISTADEALCRVTHRSRDALRHGRYGALGGPGGGGAGAAVRLDGLRDAGPAAVPVVALLRRRLAGAPRVDHGWSFVLGPKCVSSQVTAKSTRAAAGKR